MNENDIEINLIDFEITLEHQPFFNEFAMNTSLCEINFEDWNEPRRFDYPNLERDFTPEGG